MGIMPTRIEALGVTLESKDQRDLLLLLILVNLYALVGFIIYAWADFHLHLRINKNARSGYITSFMTGRATWLESINYFFRLLFDFFIPPTYGIYAIHRIYTFIHPNFSGALSNIL